MRLSLLIAILLLSFTGFTQQFYLFVGTYTTGDSKGIYVYRFDAGTGEAKPVSTATTENPSYLALAPDGKNLYAVNETNGAKPGGVSAFSFDKGTGQLTFLNKVASGGDDPCYISVDSKRKWALIANYNGGSLAAVSISPDGYLGGLSQLIQHSGTGFDPKRQEKPHVHSTILSPDEHYLLSADLGLDKVYIYRFNGDDNKKPLSVSADDSVFNTHPGAGPRHLSFPPIPGMRYAYLVNELEGTVDAFHYVRGKLKPMQHLSSHPEGYTGTIGSADIHVSENGKFLYVSNRGDANNLAIYGIDEEYGRLTLKGFQSTLGQAPRNFMVDPTGHWLLVANQKSNNIVVFRINGKTGLLTQAGQPIEVPSPVCLKMLKK